ncbi:MAG: LysM peptidoglycan-binding domain-containing protein [Oscillospiraceae bacterium]|nr:LysM peptidoglycan-binding domain-containing protein [Oscillospiraceae bacterium]
MTKRIICLFLAVLMFAAIPFAGAFAAGEDEPYVIGKETMEQICQKKGLDYNFCKDAIVKLNGWTDESDFTTLIVGATIKIPKTNQDAALILGKDLPAGLLPKSEAETIDYVVKDKDTMISICKDKGLDYSKCKDAILKLNGWSDYNLLTMHTGDKIKLPKTNADAAVIIAKSSSTTPSGITPLTPTDGAVAAYMVPYVVKTGDTLYGICLANGIDFSRYINLIMQASGLKSATIYTGDVIFLPSSTASSGSMSIVTHVVKGGETVYGICQSLGLNYNASIGMITSLNPNKNLSNIHAGDVLFFPKGSGTTPSGGGTTPGGGGSGDGGGYVPASGDPPVTQTVPKAKEGFNFALEEVTIKTDDTVYNLLKAKGMDAQYFNYYISIMLTANNRGTFSNLKDGEKILITTNNSAASIVIKGVKVKDGDTVIKMCETAKISYNDNVTLINKLNSSLNFSNLKTGDIVLLPFKS